VHAERQRSIELALLVVAIVRTGRTLLKTTLVTLSLRMLRC
jgi:hypothetical protein